VSLQLPLGYDIDCQLLRHPCTRYWNLPHPDSPLQVALDGLSGSRAGVQSLGGGLTGKHH
jgi:hypothetical protein